MTDTPIPPTNQPGKTAWEPMVLKKVGRLGDIMQGGGTTSGGRRQEWDGDDAVTSRCVTSPSS